MFARAPHLQDPLLAPPTYGAGFEPAIRLDILPAERISTAWSSAEKGCRAPFVHRAMTMAKNDKNRAPTVPPQKPKESHDMGHEQMGEHEGATEEQVAPTTPPTGPAFDDEPKQG
jgi:hypothetical protein